MRDYGARISGEDSYVRNVDAAGERKTQRDVAEIAGVTEVTIRNRYKELAEQLDIQVIL